MTDHKACSKCGVVKPLADFAPDGRWQKSHQARCHECDRLAKVAARAANPEKHRVACAAYQKSHAEQLRAYRAANAERRRAAAAAWQAANPEAVNRYHAERRARKQGAPVVERIYRAKVWERDGGRCHICGRKADPNNWHLEHLVPLVLGGEHSYRNVAVAHPACNLRKGRSGPAQLRLQGGEALAA